MREEFMMSYGKEIKVALDNIRQGQKIVQKYYKKHSYKQIEKKWNIILDKVSWADKKVINWAESTFDSEKYVEVRDIINIAEDNYYQNGTEPQFVLEVIEVMNNAIQKNMK